MSAIRRLDPLWYLERALQRRLIRRVEGYAAESEPGSPAEAEWIMVAERLRAEMDGRARLLRWRHERLGGFPGGAAR